MKEVKSLATTRCGAFDEILNGGFVQLHALMNTERRSSRFSHHMDNCANATHFLAVRWSIFIGLGQFSEHVRMENRPGICKFIRISVNEFPFHIRPPVACRGAPHLLDPLCQSCWIGSQLGAVKSPQALSNLQCWVSWLKRWLCCLWWAEVPHLTPPLKTSRDGHSAPRNEDISLSVGWQV